MRTTFSTLILAVMLAALALAGCGDSESSGSGDTRDTAGTQIDFLRTQIDSKAELIEVANGVCAEVRAQIRSAAARAVKEDPDRAADLVAEELFSQDLGSRLETEVYALRMLDVPPGEAQQVDAILAATEQVLAEARSDPAAFANQERPFARPEELADKYGLTACGRP